MGTAVSPLAQRFSGQNIFDLYRANNARNIANAVPFETLRPGEGLDEVGQIGNLPDSGYISYLQRGSTTERGYVPAARLREGYLSNRGRVQDQYTGALAADSTLNPEGRFGQLEAGVLADGDPSAASRGYNRMSLANRAERATNQSLGTMQRQVRATGIKQDATELGAMQRRIGLARVLNRVDASNMADRAMDERRTMVRDYAFDAEGQAQNYGGQGLASAAAAENERRAGKAAADAGRTAGYLGLAGSVIGTVAAFSSAALKENIEPAPSILDGLAQLDLKRWNYLGDSEAHVGPIAEDFQNIFGIGDGVTLKLVDVMGVMIGAIKEMAEKAKHV